MLTMDQIHRIRELYYVQGKNLIDIATIMNCDWRTVRKYVDMENFNASPPMPEEHQNESKLDSFKPLIDSWLSADKKAPRKQRHSAKRVHRRLKEEAKDYNCSYRLVAAYVSLKKKELHLKNHEGYIPLEHSPGEGQADFGYADFYENGKLHHEAKYLVLSFPYSNGGYLQLNYGENMECLFEGLVTMFEHIGGVPTEIWFDNTRTIVTDIIKGGGRNVTERFLRFCEYYRIKPIFMNPESGWEKGNVENKVGYLRRNELVPVPKFTSIVEKNKELLIACDRDMEREHYDDDKKRFISELFEEDKVALLPLPSIPFDTALYTTARTDKYGKFTLDNGRHRYSASPAFCEDTVRLRITSSEVIVMDSCESSERGKVLKVLAELTERSNFTVALNTVDEAIRFHATDSDSLQNLYRRTYAEVPLLPPLENLRGIPLHKVIPFRNDLAGLDVVLKKRGADGG